MAYTIMWADIITLENTKNRLKLIITKVWPLPLLYLGNMLFGLGSTKELSLPMLTALRRVTILMTMAGEYFTFKTKPSVPVQLSVYAMIFGSLLAAADDLGFSLIG